MLQRQALGEAAVFVAGGGADQAVQPLPDIRLVAQAVDAGKQLSLAVAARGIVVQQGAQGPVLAGQALPLGVQRLHSLAQLRLWLV